ncbi:MAG: FecR family protein [Deltaproteobacteria bacterium]|nr:FecR family protein [Deltaproteobacteria bacterium]
MKRNYLLKIMMLWIVILFPLWAHAEDLGYLRLSQLEGDVQIQSKGATEWFPAAINLPIQAGDRFWVPNNAWAQIETREGSVIRIDADSSLEILAVEKDSLQMYLSQGQAYLNFRKMDDAMLQMDTPISSLRVYDSSTFNVALVQNGNTDISVYRGAVYAENRNGEVRVGAGKMLSLDEGMPSLMALEPPSDWEKWNRDWDESLTEDVGSDQYLPQELSEYGRDLNRNGRWIETTEYGNVWTPTTHIDADWAPYREGRWVWIGDDYVWIASEPWGWAPYHYGRWSYISSYGWCWVPPPRNEVYWGPGYVSWVATENDVAWVPLAPAEVYYGYGNYGPHSVNIVNANIYAEIPGSNYRNAHVHNAVTVVNRDTFLTGRHHDVGHRENPFLRERISIGRPRIEPGRITKMPIIKNIPRINLPPANIRSLPGRAAEGARPMVRERDRSVFAPTATPRPLAPAVRMTPGPDERKQILEHSVMPSQYRGRQPIDADAMKSAMPPATGRPQNATPPVTVPRPPAQSDERNAPGFRGRSQNPEYNVMPGQFRGRPTIDTDAIKAARPPETGRPQIAPPPAPAPQPPAQNEERNAPGFRGRSQAPEHNVMPEQFRGRPTIDREAVRSASPPPPSRPQIAPPPPPAPRPPAQNEERNAPGFRGRPQAPEQNVMPGQFRGRPAMDREAVRPAPPPAPVRPQNVPPPAPPRPQIAPPPARGPGQPPHLDPETLKRLKKQQEADKKD